MASQPCRSGESCQRKVTGCLATSAMAQYASWSQLEPGKMMTPNFMANSSCAGWAPKLELKTLFHPNQPVVYVNDFASEHVELGIERQEARIHFRPELTQLRTQIADARILVVEANDEHHQRQTKRCEELSVAHALLYPASLLRRF